MDAQKMNEKDKLMVWLIEHMETKPLRLTELMAQRLLDCADKIDRLERAMLQGEARCADLMMLKNQAE